MITQEYLKVLFSYDPDTGLFTRNISRGASPKGRIVGTLDTKKRVQICIDGGYYFAHRLAWLYVHGEFPKNGLDHINNNCQDNRISNLREATNGENQCNTGARRTNRSGFKGVSKQDNGWTSRITKDGRVYYLGFFPTAAEAGEAYKIAAKKLHKDFAYYKDVDGEELKNTEDGWKRKKRCYAVSGIPGVSKSNNGWIARIYGKPGPRYLGYFKDIESAKAALDEYKKIKGA